MILCFTAFEMASSSAFAMRDNMTIKVSPESEGLISICEISSSGQGAPTDISGSSKKMLACEVRYNFNEDGKLGLSRRCELQGCICRATS